MTAMQREGYQTIDIGALADAGCCACGQPIAAGDEFTAILSGDSCRVCHTTCVPRETAADRADQPHTYTDSFTVDAG